MFSVGLLVNLSDILLPFDQPGVLTYLSYLHPWNVEEGSIFCYWVRITKDGGPNPPVPTE